MCCYVELLAQQSPSPALRACYSLAQVGVAVLSCMCAAYMSGGR
jgi:hypothetical protein